MQKEAGVPRVVWVVRMELYGSTTAVEIWSTRQNRKRRVSHLRSGVDGELELGLLAVVDRETFHEQGGEPGAGAPSERVEDEETLQFRLCSYGVRLDTWRPVQLSARRRIRSRVRSMISLPMV